MKKPWYQKLTASYIPWIFVGFLFVGTLLDTISNALQFITPTVSCLGSLTILSVFFFLGFRIRKHPIVWVTEDNQHIYIKSLGPKPILVLTGILVALWLPRFIGTDQGKSPATEPLDLTQNLVYSTPTERSVVIGSTTAIFGNDLKDEILSFYPKDIRDSLELNSANLDGYNKEEIIVTRSSNQDFTQGPGFFIDVFAYISDNDRWQQVLHVENIQCILSFGIINLKKDDTRQWARNFYLFRP